MTDPAAHDSPSERDVEPLDLDAIEARVWRLTCAACGAVDPPTERGEFFEGSVFDRHIDCPKQPELFAAEVNVHGLSLSQQRALVAEVRRLRTDNDALRARVAELERLAAGPSTTETVTMTHDMIATWGRAFG